jgi:hypothetical protein
MILRSLIAGCTIVMLFQLPDPALGANEGEEVRVPWIGFMAPTVGPGSLGPATVRTTGDEVLQGKVATLLFTRHGLSRLTLQQEGGNKRRFRAAEVDEVVIDLGVAAHVGMLLEATTTVRKAFRGSLPQRIDHDQVVFRRFAWPRPSDSVLLQLVNPGFDSRIGVYYLQSAKKGSITVLGLPITGDESKAFVVVKDHGEPLSVTSRHYARDQFDLLFGDCAEMLQRQEAADRDFDSFARHVWLYDQLCGPG